MAPAHRFWAVVVKVLCQPQPLPRVLTAFTSVCSLLLLGGCSAVDWSPDGKRVVTSWPDASGRPVLRVFDVGTGAYRTIPNSRGAVQPAWSPDGAYIAFAASQAEGGVYLFHVATGRTTLLHARAIPPLVWREDSARLLAANRAGGCISLTVPDGFPTWETEGLTTDWDNASVAWVPNTDNVAVLSSGDIYLIEGAQPTRLTTTGDVIGMGLRQGGTELVWARRGKDPTTALFTVYVMSLKQRSAERVPLPVAAVRKGGIWPDRNAEVTHVTFSPDGKRMAVLLTMEKSGKRTIATLYSVSLHGTDVRLIRTMDVTGTAEQYGVAAPVFSNDGQNLAFVVPAPRAALIVCRADGTGCRTVACATVPWRR